MDHLAILKKDWLAKIISGEKTIESRWSKHRRAPYKIVKAGDVVYLKTTGNPVSACTNVKKVLFFDKLDVQKVKEILNKYGNRICIDVSHANDFSGKKFCTLIFLGKVKPITPFKVNKKGYGLMTAWISLDNINKVTSSPH